MADKETKTETLCISFVIYGKGLTILDPPYPLGSVKVTVEYTAMNNNEGLSRRELEVSFDKAVQEIRATLPLKYRGIPRSSPTSKN